MKTFQIETPGDKPYAASSLILHEAGLVLAVSRKHDFNDLGLPGGKLDPGENFSDACIRETFEETGLIVTKLIPIYGAYCGRAPKNVVHWNLTFLCKAVGKIQTSEKGRVVWVPFERIIYKDLGINQTYNSFGEYNQFMQGKFIEALKFLDLNEYVSNIKLLKGQIEK